MNIKRFTYSKIPITHENIKGLLSFSCDNFKTQRSQCGDIYQHLQNKLIFYESGSEGLARWVGY